MSQIHKPGEVMSQIHKPGEGKLNLGTILQGIITTTDTQTVRIDCLIQLLIEKNIITEEELKTTTRKYIEELQSKSSPIIKLN